MPKKQESKEYNLMRKNALSITVDKIGATMLKDVDAHFYMCTVHKCNIFLNLF